MPELERRGPVPSREGEKPVAMIDSAYRRPAVVGPDVAGKLLADNRSYGLSLIERVDDVIAIAHGFRTGIVGVVASGVGIPNHVHPVAAPTLAVMRRGKQAVDDLRVGFR